MNIMAMMSNSLYLKHVILKRSRGTKCPRNKLFNKTEVTSVKLILFKYVMSFETLRKVDQLTEIVKDLVRF